MSVADLYAAVLSLVLVALLWGLGGAVRDAWRDHRRDTEPWRRYWWVERR